MGRLHQPDYSGFAEDAIPNEDPMVENIYKKLEEAADLHSPDCCSNSDHGCDACMKEMDCCDNMRFLRTTLLRFKEEVEGKRVSKIYGSVLDGDAALHYEMGKIEGRAEMKEKMLAAITSLRQGGDYNEKAGEFGGYVDYEKIRTLLSK